MKPAKVNLVIYQGATFKKEWWWRRKDRLSGEVFPYDLTDADIYMQIRRTTASSPIQLDASQYITVVTPLEGHFVIDIPASVTAGLDFNEAAYDIQVVFPDGETVRPLEGLVRLSYSITKVEPEEPVAPQ